MLQPAAFQALVVTVQDATRSLEAMDHCMNNVALRLRELEMAIKRHNERVTALLKQAGARPAPNVLADLQTTQMSFNLQYLQLQSQMQHENRSYTAISNIMKTKHDTVKNSISNVR